MGGVTDWIGDRSAMATGAAAAHSAGFPAAKSMAVVLTDRRLAFFRQKQSLLRAKAGDHLGDVRLDDLTEVYAEDGRQTGTAITGQTTRFGLVAFRVRSGHQVVLQALHLAAPGLFLASFGAGSAPDRAG